MFSKKGLRLLRIEYTNKLFHNLLWVVSLVSVSGICNAGPPWAGPDVPSVPPFRGPTYCSNLHVVSKSILELKVKTTALMTIYRQTNGRKNLGVDSQICYMFYFNQEIQNIIHTDNSRKNLVGMLCSYFSQEIQFWWTKFILKFQ